MSHVDCSHALAHLQDYLKQEITPELAREIQEHLNRCRRCFRHARFEANFLVMLETRAAHGTCPKELRARIVSKLRAEAEPEDA